MKNVLIVLTFLFMTLSIFSTDNYFEFSLDKDSYNYQQVQIVLNQSNVSRVELQLYSNYEFFKSYFNLSSWGSGNTYTIQLGFNAQTLWQHYNQRLLSMFKKGLLSSSGTKIGEGLLFDSNGKQLDFVDIYFVVDDFFVDYTVSNEIVFVFSPPYPGNGPWYDQKTSHVSLESNLLPLHIYIDLELLDGFDFLSQGSYLQFLSSPDIYLNNGNVEFDVNVGSDLGNLFNNHGSLLQEKYVEAGSPTEGLHVADVVISIPMEGGYFSYEAIPVYFKVPEPSINFIIGEEGTIQLTFDLSNPQNNVISSVPVHIESTLQKYDIYLSIDIFDTYSFLADYIILQNEQVITVESGNIDFDIEIKANFADLWNDKREQILSLFENEVLIVNEVIHIGDVYITLSSS
ncbi:hypothetical protein [Petrotoga olearia]|uniref:Uncharacterized protein n=2 Tax=Petrotoga olearia TaxID=156203 RepID=A0A2K1P5Y3_9BACT|nr:hypothetical protein [Petrotoga olearia]PNR98136.1 hypothetical protein X929_01630 [Petrotoga olearia DSM 13574]RMA75678.1 hypothetical protein C8D75_0691 [Petrotoga olearia]